MHLVPFDPLTQSDARICQTDKEVVVQWSVPGCQDIQVYVDKQSLTLLCAINYHANEGESKISYSGQFKQKLTLPVLVRGETAQTSYENGVIEVKIARQG